MAGTSSGGVSAMKTNKKLYGEDFAKVIGQLGGSVKGRKGFATNRKLAKKAGKRGGKVSRRTAGISRPYRKPVECRFCYSKDHLTYSCELREQMLAAKRVADEQAQENRSLMSRLAQKWETNDFQTTDPGTAGHLR
jgi:general stress protein YciG